VTSADARGGSLRANAVGLISATVVGLASTAPAYSLAAAFGAIVIAVGAQAPAVVLLGFFPTFLIALACQELNRAEPNCGTSFIWAARSFGPSLGWLAGWAMIATDVLVMASMAQVAAQYGLILVGAVALPHATAVTTLIGVAFIVAMSWLCFFGVELSVRTQSLLLAIELLVLFAFGGAALFQVYSGSAAPQSIRPALGWFDPLAISPAALATGVLLAVFIYWGWDTALAVNEETIDSEVAPGRAAVLSTLILLGTYAFVTVGALAFGGDAPQSAGATAAGCGSATAGSGDRLLQIGTSVFHGGPWTRMLEGATLASALAAMQTTVLGAARAMLSMARLGALPSSLMRVHSRYKTPGFAAIVAGAISVIYFILLSSISTDVLEDSADSIGVMVAFYYALTAFACAWRFRNDFGRSPAGLLRRIVLPASGGVLLCIALVRSASDMAAVCYGKTSFAGVGGVFLLGVTPFVLGVLILALGRAWGGRYFRGESLADRDS